MGKKEKQVPNQEKQELEQFFVPNVGILTKQQISKLESQEENTKQEENIKQE